MYTISKIRNVLKNPATKLCFETFLLIFTNMFSFLPPRGFFEKERTKFKGANALSDRITFHITHIIINPYSTSPMLKGSQPNK